MRNSRVITEARPDEPDVIRSTAPNRVGLHVGVAQELVLVTIRLLELGQRALPLLFEHAPMCEVAQHPDRAVRYAGRVARGRPDQLDEPRAAGIRDLQLDLEGVMRGLAARVGIEVDESAWPVLIRAASFAEMRARASSLLPDQNGILNDPVAFFRRGTSGAAREVLSEAELARYDERAGTLAPAELLQWLHRI